VGYGAEVDSERKGSPDVGSIAPVEADVEAGAEGELTLPPGAPVRTGDWLAGPLFSLVVAVFLAVRVAAGGTPHLRVPALALAAVLVVSAIALVATGLQAYFTVTVRAIANLRLAQACTIGACGLVLSFTAAPLTGIVLAGAGLRLVGSSAEVGIVRRAHLVLAGGSWERVAILAAVVAFIAQVCVPLAFGLGVLPLSILVQLILIGSSVVAGFALASRA
jgi:hypothetical protein